MTRIVFMAAILACGMSGFQIAAAQTAYKFINIADDSGPFRAFTFSTSINDGGVVAFSATLDDGGSGVFTGRGGSTSTIVDSKGPFSGFSLKPSINNSGMVAFHGFLDAGGGGIFTSDGGPIATIALTDLGSQFSVVDAPSINNSGFVAFVATLRNSNVRGVYRGGEDPITTIADTAGPFSSFRSMTDINDGGVVAFVAGLDAGGGGIFTGSGGPTTSISTSAPEIKVSINADSDVPYRNREGLFVSRGGPVKTIADVTGPFRSFSVDPAINDQGVVAFHAALDGDLGGGLFSGGDPVRDQVIRIGDALFNSTATSLALYPDINNRGDISFRYTLASGVQGIAVAVVVPEPQGVGMAVWLGALVVLRAPGPRRPGSLDWLTAR